MSESLNPFFKKVNTYIDKKWQEYKSGNFITSDIYNKEIYRENLFDMNKNKVFNYLILLMETENNMKVLSELIPKLKGYKSKLILYSYDSFLFDFSISDGLEFIGMIKKTLEQGGTYPVKIAKGSNLLLSIPLDRDKVIGFLLLQGLLLALLVLLSPRGLI